MRSYADVLVKFMMAKGDLAIIENEGYMYFWVYNTGRDQVIEVGSDFVIVKKGPNSENPNREFVIPLSMFILIV